MKKLKLSGFDTQNSSLTRDQLRNVLGGNVAPFTDGTGCYKCQEQGEWVYDYGTCESSGAQSCDLATCSEYAC